MLRLVPTLTAVLMLAACTSDEPNPVARPSPTFSVQERFPVEETPPGSSDDVAAAFRFYTESHPRPFFAAGRARLRAAYEGLESAADDLSRPRMIVGLMRVLALPGRLGGRDGHSGIYPLESHPRPLHLYPLRLYWFADGLFVVDATEEHRDLIGARLVAIDGTPIERVIDEVEPLVPRDNVMSMRARLPQYLVVEEVLRGLGIASRDGAVFRFEDEDRISEVSPEPVTGSEYTTAFDYWNPLIPPSLPQRPRPLYLSRADRRWWLTLLDGRDTLYVQYNRTVDDTAPLAARFVRLFREGDPSKVIVDLRHNPGGDINTYEDFLDAVTQPRITREAKLFLLLGRSTFSAAAHFVMDVLERTDATVAGERSGFAPNQFGDPTTEILPASGLAIDVATIYWLKTTPRDDRLWLAPDIRVTPISSDFFAGRDPVLEAVLSS